MKLIFDADSLIYASCFKSKDDRLDKDDLFETDVDVAFEKFTDGFQRCLSFLEERVAVDEVVFCNGSINNFRKNITPTYKANRTAKRPEILGALHNLVKFTYDSVWGDGVPKNLIIKNFKNTLNFEILEFWLKFQNIKFQTSFEF